MHLTNEDLSRVFLKHNLPKVGIEYVLSTRNSAPARRPSSSPLSEVTLVASRSMGHSVLAESTSIERAFVYEKEFLKTPGEFWDQPLSVPIEGTNRNGKRYRSSYTADFLVIDESGVVAVECKPISKLTALADERPSDWKLNGEKWIYLPGQAAFSRLGIRHVVLHENHFDPVRTSNIRLLLQARYADRLPQFRSLRRRALKTIRSHSALTLADLALRIGIRDKTPLLQLIDDEDLHCALDAFRLEDPQSVWVTAERSLSSSLGDLSKFGFRWRDLAPIDSDQVLNPKQGERLLNRLKSLHGDPGCIARTDRTLRTYAKKLERSKNDPRSLIDKFSRSGNRKPRYTPEHIDFVHTFIEENYNVPNGPSLLSVYKEYTGTFPSQILKLGSAAPMSMKKFRSIAMAGFEESEGKRGGARAAAAARPTVPGKKVNLRPLRAFETAHIDHYRSDITTIVARTKNATYTDRAWVTVLVDSFSGDLLAFTLSYDHPSRASCARLLRDCVRRHRRLPEAIVNDGGAEFGSAFWEAALADLSVNKGHRLEITPRWGARVETAFKIYRNFLNSQPGNLQNNARGRAVSKTHRSDATAALTLFDQYKEFERFAFEWYPNELHGGMTTAPRILLNESLREFSCSGVAHQYDRTFLAKTSVPCGDFKFVPGRGFHKGESWFFSTAMIGFDKSHCEGVRQDPEDRDIVYVEIEGEYIPCTSTPIADSVGVSFERRLTEMIAATEAKKAKAVAKKEASASLGRLLRELKEDRTVPKTDAEDHAPVSPIPKEDEIEAPGAPPKQAPLAPIKSSYMEQFE